MQLNPVQYNIGPEDEHITYEEIQKIYWRRHDVERFGDNDTM